MGSLFKAGLAFRRTYREAKLEGCSAELSYSRVTEVTKVKVAQLNAWVNTAICTVLVLI